MKNFIKSFALLYIFPFFCFSISMTLLLIFSSFTFLLPFLCLIFFIIIIFFYDKQLLKINILNEKSLKLYTLICTFITVVLCLLFIISNGSISSQLLNIFFIIAFPFFPLSFITLFAGMPIIAIIIIQAVLVLQLFICFYIVKPTVSFKKIGLISIVFLLAFISNTYFYNNRAEIKYAGHGFDYMNGYSSTDLTDYYPYATNSKLVKLNEASLLTITNEDDMPILDGAEACYPVYSAIARAVYKDIDKIENDAKDTEYQYSNGKIVSFTNTSMGYTRLFNSECDMFFGAKPSQGQIEEAKYLDAELEYTPIGKEGFVFFVNKDNPIDNLTTNQVKAIYHGDITNWKEVGGKDEKITAFQRPERSGSQSMMNYFMGDVSLKEPLTFEMQTGMGGIIEEVAQYHNESGAIGYTFRYFLEGLNQEKDVKILSIDGIKPTTDNIKNQTYPISTYLYCVTLTDNRKTSVETLKDFLLSKQGQYIIEETGYCALK